MLHHPVLSPTRTKARCHCDNCSSAFTENEHFSFPFFPSRGEAEVISVPHSRVPHKSPLWKGRAARLCSWGRKQVLFSLGLRYTAGSIRAETQTPMLWDRLLRQPGLIKDHRFPPCQAPENSASDFYIAWKGNDALYNVSNGNTEVRFTSTTPPARMPGVRVAGRSWGASVSPSTIPRGTEQSFPSLLASTLLLDFKAKLWAPFPTDSPGL